MAFGAGLVEDGARVGQRRGRERGREGMLWPVTTSTEGAAWPGPRWMPAARELRALNRSSASRGSIKS